MPEKDTLGTRWSKLPEKERESWVNRIISEMSAEDLTAMRRMVNRINIRRFGISTLVEFLISLNLNHPLRDRFNTMLEGMLDET